MTDANLGETPRPFKSEPVEFWFLWHKHGRVPRYCHDTYELALAEAERLARKSPGKKLIILHAVSKHHIAADGYPEGFGEPVHHPSVVPVG